jgi:hypothetical protein
MEGAFNVGLWFAVIGAAIALGIAIGQSRYLRREQKRPATLATGAFGFGAAFVAGAIAQATYVIIGPTEILRDACWGLAGGLIGAALSVRIPNLGIWRGLLGGLAGGLIGGGLFIALAFTLSDFLGRLIGTAAIGFMIGLMIVLSESLLREGWLEIHFGPREMRTVSLGREPVRIGSDSSFCTVYVTGAAPVAYTYTVEKGQIRCEDSNGNSTIVLPGTGHTVGKVTIVVRGA